MSVILFINSISPCSRGIEKERTADFSSQESNYIFMIFKIMKTLISSL